jgi:glycosyltransferase involved in cell wall biosynthesis
MKLSEGFLNDGVTYESDDLGCNGLTKVSIVIPTQNVAQTFANCLTSIVRQKGNNDNFETEIIVIDGHSSDQTLDIARRFDCKVLFYDGLLLGKRVLGINESRGDFILLLDSDQVLRPDLLYRALPLMEGSDMMMLEEGSQSIATITQLLYNVDRQLVHRIRDMDPRSSVLLPRLFRASVLKHAVRRIPPSLLPLVCAQDHAILYYETWCISKRIGYVSDALAHSEPDSLTKVFRKNFRYGKCDRRLARTGYYVDLLKSRTRIRKGLLSIRDPRLVVGTLLLQGMKGAAYALGYIGE